VGAAYIPSSASAARELLNKSENEALRRAVDGDVVPRSLSRSRGGDGDAAMRLAHPRLVESGRPATLYLVVPPSDISRTKPLVRLILKSDWPPTDGEARRQAPPTPPVADARRVPALGRLDFFESALAFMPVTA